MTSLQAMAWEGLQAVEKFKFLWHACGDLRGYLYAKNTSKVLLLFYSTAEKKKRGCQSRL